MLLCGQLRLRLRGGLLLLGGLRLRRRLLLVVLVVGAAVPLWLRLSP
jgi:hypothetical protein